MTEVRESSCEVRIRRWNWLGHVLRREGVNECFTEFTALGWTPESQMTRGRPKTTWRRIVEGDSQGWVEELERGQDGGTR